MFKNKLEVFIAKRVLILFVLLLILDVLLIEQRWSVLEGMIIGGIYGLAKFSSTVNVYSNILSPQKNSSVNVGFIIKYIVFQLFAILLLVLTLLADFWIFCGTAAGILLVPAVIMVNGITDGLGITHNRFE